MGNTVSCGCIDQLKDEKSTEVLLESLDRQRTDLRAEGGPAFRFDSDFLHQKFNDCSFVRNSDKNLTNSIDRLGPDADHLSFIGLAPLDKSV